MGMANLATPLRSNRFHIVGRSVTLTSETSFIPADIIASTKIGPGPKLIYSRLLAYAATNEPATNKRLAADLAVSLRSVGNYIRALKNAGLVEVQLVDGNTRSFKLATSL